MLIPYSPARIMRILFLIYLYNLYQIYKTSSKIFLNVVCFITYLIFIIFIKKLHSVIHLTSCFFQTLLVDIFMSDYWRWEILMMIFRHFPDIVFSSKLLMKRNKIVRIVLVKTFPRNDTQKSPDYQEFFSFLCE